MSVPVSVLVVVVKVLVVVVKVLVVVVKVLVVEKEKEVEVAERGLVPRMEIGGSGTS